MANEIYAKHTSGKNLDAYVFKKTNDQVFDQTDGGDTFEVWADGNVLNYDIPMTDQGDGFYTVDFPSVITTAAIYRVVVKLRVGANAAVGDTGLFQGPINWDGTAEIDLFTLNTKIEDDVIGAGGDTLESISDQVTTVVAGTVSPINVYRLRE